MHANPAPPLLIVVCGPTASGKSDMAVWLARELETAVICADSRQCYKYMTIGTAAPDEEQKRKAEHYLTAFLEPDEDNNASRFEKDALNILSGVFAAKKCAVLCGGSGLYIKALCEGIDELPDPDETIRSSLKNAYHQYGIEYLRNRITELDPVYARQVDLNNPVRLIRAIEICMITGKAFSSLRKGEAVKRPFRILKIGIMLPREVLFERINSRTDAMIRAGWIDEAKKLIRFRHLNSLNTLGYKELFMYIDGRITLSEAVEKIKTNTRRYAKRQITWFMKDPEINWVAPDEKDKILHLIKEASGNS